MRNVVLVGDVHSRLAEIPTGTVQCVVTSPPYWQQRDYGTRVWFDPLPQARGESGSPCSHTGERILHHLFHKGQPEQTKWKKADTAGKGQNTTTETCKDCGSWLGQLGLEPDPEDYVDHMVQIFREVKRTLREDGCLWLNLGDTYIPSKVSGDGRWKTKQLVGVSWMVALGLQRDGWYLRSDLIWEKPNAMPESVRDRPTNSHEYLFLLTKSARYYYDTEAVKEDSTDVPGEKRNLRSVWSMKTKPYKGAHFAVFPDSLPERCIRLGTSEHGSCGICGGPYRREMVRVKERQETNGVSLGVAPDVHGCGGRREKSPGKGGGNRLSSVVREATGKWVPTCKCGVGGPVKPCLVLDPFAGSGTTLRSAKDLGRDYLGIEVNPEYAKLITERLGGVVSNSECDTQELTTEEDLFRIAFSLGHGTCLPLCSPPELCHLLNPMEPYFSAYVTDFGLWLVGDQDTPLSNPATPKGFS